MEKLPISLQTILFGAMADQSLNEANHQAKRQGALEEILSRKGRKLE